MQEGREVERDVGALDVEDAEPLGHDLLLVIVPQVHDSCDDRVGFCACLDSKQVARRIWLRQLDEAVDDGVYRCGRMDRESGRSF